MKKFNLLIGSAALAIGLFACKSSQKSVITAETPVTPPKQEQPAIVPPKATMAVTTPLQLANKKWQLVWMSATDIKTVDYRGKLPFVTFDTEKSTLNGNSGCNNFGGSIEISNNTLKVGMLFSTKMFCEGIPEPEFLRSLEGATKYEVVDGMLMLYDNADQLVMKLKN
jgi:heat shock protein HslJ